MVVQRVWNATFSLPGFAVASALGCLGGAVYNALRMPPNRYVCPPYPYDEDGYYEQISEEYWIIEGMWYGGLVGFLANLTWPVLLIGGLPLGCIYTGARFLQQHKFNDKKD